MCLPLSAQSTERKLRASGTRRVSSATRGEQKEKRHNSSLSVGRLLSGVKEVHFGVEGDVPLCVLEMNVPSLGKLVGEVAPAVDAHPGEDGALVYNAHRAPKPPPPTVEEIEQALGVDEAPDDDQG